MKRIDISILSLAAAACLCSGCSDRDEKAAAIRSFTESCKTQVTASLTLSSWSNSLVLSCGALDPRFVRPVHPEEKS